MTTTLTAAPQPVRTSPPPPAAKPARARPHWPELDVLRGLAAVLMVYNHAGVRFSRGPEHWLGNALEFAGSLAPVVFFLVTGLGRGVQSAAGGARRPLDETLRKVALLLLADVALWLSPARLAGMDFLGFIAISTLVVEVLARSARPQLLAWLALGGVLGLRVVGAPLLRSVLGESGLMFLVGDQPLLGFSYPPCPWLAYPILGYLLGTAAQRHADAVRRHAGRVLLLCLGGAASFGAASLALHARGALFFRWGTVSVAFTVLSFAAVFATLAAAFALARSSAATRALALPGTSSLVIVPVHYGLIELLVRTAPELATGASFPLAATLLVGVALVTARGIDRLIGARVAPRAGLWWPLFAGALAMLVVVYLSHGTAARLPSMMVAQLALCALFAMRGKKAG